MIELVNCEIIIENVIVNNEIDLTTLQKQVRQMVKSDLIGMLRYAGVAA